MLLWVILFSNLMAFLIQVLSAKLGIATGKNLPEIARDRYPKWVSAGLWIQGELVIMATDLAEFIGAALGLNLLFGIPMVEAAIIAAIGSFAILELQRRGYRALEAGIAGLLFVVVIAFALQTFFAKPDAASVLEGLFIPKIDGMDSVLLATGILGATVMPHAIYLHSALTQRRVVGKTDSERKKIFRFETIDILIAMVIAGAINASMLIVAAALFFKNGLYVEDLDVAYQQFGHYISTGFSHSLRDRAAGCRAFKLFCRHIVRRYYHAGLHPLPYPALFAAFHYHHSADDHHYLGGQRHRSARMEPGRSFIRHLLCARAADYVYKQQTPDGRPDEPKMGDGSRLADCGFGDRA